MIKINMFSAADKVAGQGVGSAYQELLYLMDNYLNDEFVTTINKHDNADLTHYHTINFPYYLSTFAPKKRGRRIGYVHFLPSTLEGSIKIPQPFKSIFYKYVISFYNRMDTLVVVNPSFIYALTEYGIPRDKIKFIPNFVSSKEFYPLKADEKAELREKYGYRSDDFIIIGDGQIQARKGVADFIKMAEDNPDNKYIWAGGFSFGKITDGYDYFKGKVDNPPENLWFPGIVERSELMNLLNIADVFLLPSYEELFPMSVLEAFNVHLPVVLRDLDLYKNIITGYYESDPDKDGMEQIIDKIKDDDQFKQKMIEKSNDGATKYSEENLSEIWRDFYENELQEKVKVNVKN